MPGSFKITPKQADLLEGHCLILLGDSTVIETAVDIGFILGYGGQARCSGLGFRA